MRILDETIYDGSGRCIYAVGTSSESKPTDHVISGSIYFEVDTSKAFMYNETSHTWVEAKGSVDEAAIEAAVAEWLEAHPEATTTVTDGSITEPKLASALLTKINNSASGVSQLSDEIVAQKETLESNHIVNFPYAIANTVNGATISSNGYVSGTSGYNVYVFAVDPGANIYIVGCDICGFYAELPQINTSVAIDSTRHFISTSGANVTIPSGCVYIAVRTNTSTLPVVTNDAETIGDTINGITQTLSPIVSAFQYDIPFTFAGFINASGNFVSNANYLSTDFIPVTANGTFIDIYYDLYAFNNTRFAFYDGEKAFIKSIQLSESATLEHVTGTLEYVSGAVYCRLSASKDDPYSARYETIKNTVTGIIPYPTDYQGSEISTFNKILCIGDSLTSGTFNYNEAGSTAYIEYGKYSFPTILSKLTGCETTNMGRGGMTSLEWYNSESDTDLSGYDCAIIQLGVNDCIRYSSWGQDSITGFTNIINKLKAENNNINIFVANIIPARSYHNSAYLAFSDAIKAFVEGLNDPQVFLLDIQQYGHTYDSDAYNCGHLSALGYWRLAQDYKAYISYIMFMHKTTFKEIQFIGTNLSYN